MPSTSRWRRSAAWRSRSSSAACPRGVTGHPGSRTTSFLVAGDAVSSANLAGAATTDHWYNITGIDVMADAAAAAVVTLGDSLTDGRGSTTNSNDRWPDNLSRRLRANPRPRTSRCSTRASAATPWSGRPRARRPCSASRATCSAERGVRWLIVFEGVNDICGRQRRPASGARPDRRLHGQFIDQAHARGIRVYGATLTPIGGSHYDSADHEAARQTVNSWIRGSGRFDAVIDLDVAVRDPANPTTLRAGNDTGDHLHLNAAGYRRNRGRHRPRVV